MTHHLPKVLSLLALGLLATCGLTSVAPVAEAQPKCFTRWTLTSERNGWKVSYSDLATVRVVMPAQSPWTCMVRPPRASDIGGFDCETSNAIVGILTKCDRVKNDQHEAQSFVDSIPAKGGERTDFSVQCKTTCQ